MIRKQALDLIRLVIRGIVSAPNAETVNAWGKVGRAVIAHERMVMGCQTKGEVIACLGR